MMSNSSGGSFIPKRSTGKVSPVRSGRRIYVFSYIAYALFFSTLLSVIGIFLLHNQAETRLQEYVTRVDAEREKFDQRPEIEQIRELDTQLQTAWQVLQWHAAPSSIFDALEDVIVGPVQLASFKYTRETGGPAELSFGGRTDTFDALLFQREAMSQSNLLASADLVSVSYGLVTDQSSTDVKFGSTQPQELTNVTFTFEDLSTLNSIGYQPRVFEREVTEESVAEDVTDNEPIPTDEADSTANEGSDEPASVGEPPVTTADGETAQ